MFEFYIYKGSTLWMLTFYWYEMSGNNWYDLYIFNCDQAALKNGSVHLSVLHPSVCPSFYDIFPQHYSHHIMMKFSGVFVIDICDTYAKGNVESKGKGHRGKTNFVPILVFPDCLNSLMVKKWHIKVKWHRRGALLFFKAIHQISRSHRTKITTPIWTQIEYFQTVTPAWIHSWLQNDTQSGTEEVK